MIRFSRGSPVHRTGHRFGCHSGLDGGLWRSSRLGGSGGSRSGGRRRSGRGLLRRQNLCLNQDALRVMENSCHLSSARIAFGIQQSSTAIENIVVSSPLHSLHRIGGNLASVRESVVHGIPVAGVVASALCAYFNVSNVLLRLMSGFTELMMNWKNSTGLLDELQRLEQIIVR